jgi:hypothetical protein
MARTITGTLRVMIVILLIAIALWLTLIAAPMRLTRWRMSRLLADYHSLYPMQSTWDDAERLIARWGRWGRYKGDCNSNDCQYLIRIDDPYRNLIDKLPEPTQERVLSSSLWQVIWRKLERLGYRSSALMILFQVQDGKIVRTYTMMHMDVVDAGPPEHWSYRLGVSALVYPRLASITMNGRSEPSRLMGNDQQLALHPDYKVGRPSGCEGCEFGYITYTPTLPHHEAVLLTNFNLNCLTRFRACTSIGDLLPEGAGWHLYDDGPSNLYPPSSGHPLPCRTEPRALARDATSVLEVEVLDRLPDFQAEPYEEGDRQELVRARILQAWKNPIHDSPGSTIQLTPFSREKASPPHWPAVAAEHLLVGHRALVFLREDAPTNYSLDPNKSGVVAYQLGPCGVVDDTSENLSTVQVGLSQDISYRHGLDDIEWW